MQTLQFMSLLGTWHSKHILYTSQLLQPLLSWTRGTASCGQMVRVQKSRLMLLERSQITECISFHWHVYSSQRFTLTWTASFLKSVLNWTNNWHTFDQVKQYLEDGSIESLSDLVKCLFVFVLLSNAFTCWERVQILRWNEMQWKTLIKVLKDETKKKEVS